MEQGSATVSNKGRDEKYKGGKSISLEANERLVEIRREVNKGNFKKKFSEREILTAAILNFPESLVEKLRKDRASGEESMNKLLKDMYEKQKSDGLFEDYDQFLKQVVNPMLSGQLKSKSKSKKVPKGATNES